MRHRLVAALTAGLLWSSLARPAAAFDWNGETTGHEVGLLWSNKMSIESGHPLATARAFAIADGIEWAKRPLERVLGTGYVGHDSDALQAVLFGNWLNEVNTNLDIGSSEDWSLEGWWNWLTGLATNTWLRLRYGKYLDGRVHSETWSKDTGYASSNFKHSMLVTAQDGSLSQDHSFDLIEEYATWSAWYATMNLAIATKAREDGGLSAEDTDLYWLSGLRHLGSIFHGIEDSAVACTPPAQALVPSCLPGDGHGVVASTSTGHWQVVALSDEHWYERKRTFWTAIHGLLDDLYRQDNLDAVYGQFDPAISNGEILAHVATHVDRALARAAGRPLVTPDGAFDEATLAILRGAADEGVATVRGAIHWRYAAAGERQKLPPVPGSGRADGGGEDLPPPAATESCAVSSGSTAWVVALAALALFRRRRPQHRHRCQLHPR